MIQLDRKGGDNKERGAEGLWGSFPGGRRGV